MAKNRRKKYRQYRGRQISSASSKRTPNFGARIPNDMEVERDLMEDAEDVESAPVEEVQAADVSDVAEDIEDLRAVDRAEASEEEIAAGEAEQAEDAKEISGSAQEAREISGSAEEARVISGSAEDILNRADGNESDESGTYTEENGEVREDRTDSDENSGAAEAKKAEGREEIDGTAESGAGRDRVVENETVSDQAAENGEVPDRVAANDTASTEAAENDEVSDQSTAVDAALDAGSNQGTADETATDEVGDNGNDMTSDAGSNQGTADETATDEVGDNGNDMASDAGSDQGTADETATDEVGDNGNDVTLDAGSDQGTADETATDEVGDNGNDMTSDARSDQGTAADMASEQTAAGDDQSAAGDDEGAAAGDQGTAFDEKGRKGRRRGKGRLKPKPWRVLTKTAKIAVIVVVCLILAGIGFFHYEYSRLQKVDPDAYSDANVIESVSKDATDSVLKKSTKSMEKLTEDLEETEVVEAEGDIFSDSDVYNILLIGTDDRTKKFSANARGDSCLLLSLNKETGKVSLLSFERGIGVPILWGPYEGEWDWLTHSFRYGGADMMVEEIRDNFKVDVTKYIRINIRTLVKIIDAMGGIDIELTQAEANHLNHPEGTYTDGYAKGVGLEDELQHDLTEGMNHLNGTTAMVLARTRAIDDDWHRIERQRRVIVAAQKRLSELNAVQLAATLDAIVPLINTNLTETEVADLMTLAPQFLNAEVTQQTIPADGTYGSMRGMDGRPMFSVDFAANAKLIRNLLYGEEAAAEIGATTNDEEANTNRQQYSQSKGYYRSGSSGSQSSGTSSAATGTQTGGTVPNDVVSETQDGTQTETGVIGDAANGVIVDPNTGAVLGIAGQTTGTATGTDGTQAGVTGQDASGQTTDADAAAAAAAAQAAAAQAAGQQDAAAQQAAGQTAGQGTAQDTTAQDTAAQDAAAQAAAQAAAAQAAAEQAQAAAAAQQNAAEEDDMGGAMGQGAYE